MFAPVLLNHTNELKSIMLFLKINLRCRITIHMLHLNILNVDLLKTLRVYTQAPQNTTATTKT